MAMTELFDSINKFQSNHFNLYINSFGFHGSICHHQKLFYLTKLNLLKNFDCYAIIKDDIAVLLRIANGYEAFRQRIFIGNNYLVREKNVCELHVDRVALEVVFNHFQLRSMRC